MTSSSRTKRWIVGMDLRPRSQGAIDFGAWLVRSGGVATGHRDDLVGIHVLEEEHLRSALRYHHLDELVSTAREAAERMLGERRVSDCYREVRIVQGGNAAKSLDAARVYHHAHGIIIGRSATKESRAVVRLGKIARRVLRGSTSPTFVVPPDWQPPTTGAGPVLAAIDLAEDCERATTFAIDLSRRLSSPLLLAHVVPLPEDYGAHYLPEHSMNELRREHQAEGEVALAEWASKRQLIDAERLVLQGGVVHSLIDAAQARNASLIVVGSRRLSMFERFLLSSIGSELAAAASCPVCIVPPTDIDETPALYLEE
jgi:nucleotide-binding universal stress UspA family protein